MGSISGRYTRVVWRQCIERRRAETGTSALPRAPRGCPCSSNHQVHSCKRRHAHPTKGPCSLGSIRHLPRWRFRLLQPATKVQASSPKPARHRFELSTVNKCQSPTLTTRIGPTSATGGRLPATPRNVEDSQRQCMFARIVETLFLPSLTSLGSS